jgi:hypothetical protein
MNDVQMYVAARHIRHDEQRCGALSGMMGEVRSGATPRAKKPGVVVHQTVEHKWQLHLT